MCLGFSVVLACLRIDRVQREEAVASSVVVGQADNGPLLSS